MVICRKCNVELNHKNWFKSQQKNKNCICKNCHYSYTKNHKEKWLKTSTGKQYMKHENWKRRARIKKVKHLFTSEEVDELFKSTDGYCPNCNNKVGINNLTLDHILPISAVPYGFEYTIEDIQPLCIQCNGMKSDYL